MMYKYALCGVNELTLEDHEALEILSTGLKTAHPNRQSSFLCARKALQKLLPGQKLIDLKLNEFHFLESYPDFVFSLAHTKEIAIAVMAEKMNYPFIGVDIEFNDREIKYGSERHYINQYDDRSLTDLELWCAKESAFKATSSLYKKNFVLKDLWIQGKNFGHKNNIENILGEIELIKREHLIISVAVLMN